MVNTRKKASVKDMPAIVASSLVKTLMQASVKRKSVMRPRPTGISTPPMRKFRGTFHSRFSGCLKRRTSTESALNEKLQTTPNA